MQNNLWTVFEYEVQTYYGMIEIREAIGKGAKWHVPVRPSSLLNEQGANTLAMNAFIESKLLHIRILVDILLERGSQEDDIHLSHLLPNWKSDKDLCQLIENLRTIYGSNKQKDSPCWTINKRLAHPTTHRGASFAYGDLFSTVDPPLKACIQRVTELGEKLEILALINSVI